MSQIIGKILFGKNDVEAYLDLSFIKCLDLKFESRPFCVNKAIFGYVLSESNFDSSYIELFFFSNF